MYKLTSDETHQGVQSKVGLLQLSSLQQIEMLKIAMLSAQQVLARTCQQFLQDHLPHSNPLPTVCPVNAVASCQFRCVMSILLCHVNEAGI